MNLQKLGYNFQIALDSIQQNKLRGFLTSLGIIFGVASVIAMLAIGQGAQEEILERLKILGTNNIIIQPIHEISAGEDEAENEKENKRYSPGLSIKDAQSIHKMIPGVASVSPEIVLETYFLRDGQKRPGKLVGVSGTFFDLSGFSLAEGQTFSITQRDGAAPVCIIGSGVKTKFFANADPIGQQIKCGKNWLTVIGVASPRQISELNRKTLGIRDYDMDIYTPIKTMLLRYKDRARISEKELQAAARGGGGMVIMRSGSDDEEEDVKDKNYHQLDRLVVTVTESQRIPKIAGVISRMLARRHNQKLDFQIIIPDLLLKQEQETKRNLNILLSAIASISLLVGGIGIMNIMLASVMERIKEIGVRLSLGATKRDIVSQFLSEAVALSVTGGLIGIILGVTSSAMIEWLSDTRASVTGLSIVLSFVVSFTVGVIFGFFPARRAANQDPVVSLRYQ